MKRGGKRDGSGRKPKFKGEKTITISIRVPESKKEYLKSLFNKLAIKHS